MIPALNEAHTIGKVVRSLKRHNFENIVVINDASQDQTAFNAEMAGAHVISLTERLGAWGATQTGFRYALRQGFQTVVTLDADEQHPVKSCETLLTELNEKYANVIVGACPDRGSGLRKIAWKWIKNTSGLELKDLTSGFRAYDKEAISTVASWRGTLLEYQDVGVLLLLIRNGLLIGDVSVDMTPRRVGASRIYYSWGVVAYYMAHTLLLGACKRTRAHTTTNARMTPRAY